MRRKIAEVIASQEAMLRRQGKKSEAIDGAQLARLFHGHLKKLDEWIQNQENFSVLSVSYNDIVNDPERIVTDIDQFLGGKLDTQSMAKVLDPSLYRQR
jgi:hypothetical protein